MSAAPRQRRQLQAALLAWYRAARRDLPWRRSREPYHVWLSEIMLQQTRVESVIPYFQRFMAALPDVAALAAAPPQRVLKLWEGLGYYARARNLRRAAQQIVRERGGEFPRDAAGWQALPGVGRYTAAAIASIAFDEPVAALDGNIKRVLSRLLAFEQPPSKPAALAALWQRAQALLDRAAPGDFNQALMELGAMVCTPRRPRCSDCALARHCRAYLRGTPEAFPRKTPRPARPTRHFVAVLLVNRGRILLVRRAERGLLGGLWELPNIAAKDAQAAAAGEALPQLVGALDLPGGAAEAIAFVPAGQFQHDFTHFRQILSVFRAEVDTRISQPERRVGQQQRCWAGGALSARLPLTRLARRVLEQL